MLSESRSAEARPWVAGRRVQRSPSPTPFQWRGRLSEPDAMLEAVPSEARYAEWPAAWSPGSIGACVRVSRPSPTSAGLVLPDACIDVIWDGASLFVAGPDTGPVPVIAQPGQFFAGVRFRPGKAPGFLGIPASELLDRRVPLADLWGRACAERLADRLASAASPEAAAGLLDDAVAHRARTAPESDPLVDDLLAMFMTTHPDAFGVVRVASRT